MQASAPNHDEHPGLSPMRLRHHAAASAAFREGREFRYRIVIDGEIFAEGTFRGDKPRGVATDISTCLFSEQRRTVGAEIQVLDPRDDRVLAAERAERHTFGGKTVTTWQRVPLPEAPPAGASAPAPPASVPAPAPA